MNPEQASLLDDLIDTDIAAIEAELKSLQAVITPPEKKQKLKMAKVTEVIGFTVMSVCVGKGNRFR
jgi:hypothetical protein